MFYWTLIKKPDKELAKKVFNAQRNFPNKDDWVSVMRNEIKKSDINLTDDQVEKLTKIQFKEIVMEKIRERCDDYLLQLQIKNKKTKMLRLSNEAKEYLTTDELTVQEKQLLFKLKVRMLDIKCNFKKSGRRFIPPNTSKCVKR